MLNGHSRAMGGDADAQCELAELCETSTGMYTASVLCSHTYSIRI